MKIRNCSTEKNHPKTEIQRPASRNIIEKLWIVSLQDLMDRHCFEEVTRTITPPFPTRPVSCESLISSAMERQWSGLSASSPRSHSFKDRRKIALWTEKYVSPDTYKSFCLININSTSSSLTPHSPSESHCCCGRSSCGTWRISSSSDTCERANWRPQVPLLSWRSALRLYLLQW